MITAVIAGHGACSEKYCGLKVSKATGNQTGWWLRSRRECSCVTDRLSNYLLMHLYLRDTTAVLVSDCIYNYGRRYCQSRENILDKIVYASMCHQYFWSIFQEKKTRELNVYTSTKSLFCTQFKVYIEPNLKVFNNTG